MSNTDEIRDLYRQYLEAQRKGDSEAVASLYTEDAKLIPPGRQPLIGRTEIGKYFEGSAGSGIELDLNHIEIEGNLAWVTGLAHWDAVEWTSTKLPDGSQSAILWKFDGDGQIIEERWFVDTEQWKAAF